MIYEFDSAAGIAAIPDPKHVWIDGDKVLVYTDADIPSFPLVSENVYTESEVIAILIASGKSESEARALVVE